MPPKKLWPARCWMSAFKGAKGVLFNVAGGNSLTLFEVSDAAKVIGEAVDPEANIIFGVNVDPNMGNEVRLTLIATGFASKRPDFRVCQR